MPKIMPVTDFRSDAAAALKTVRESKEPVVIWSKAAWSNRVCAGHPPVLSLSLSFGQCE